MRAISSLRLLPWSDPVAPCGRRNWGKRSPSCRSDASTPGSILIAAPSTKRPTPSAARALFRPPLFCLPPNQVFALLTNLLSLPATHYATQLAMLQST